MSGLSELFSQVPGLAWLFLIAVLFSVLWKVFNILYVKPRDFRIDSLEREIEALKSAPKEPKTPQPHAAGPIVPAELSTPDTTTPTAQFPEQQQDGGDALAEGLRSLDIALDRIHDDSLTMLQRESVRAYFVGKNVIWRATIRSVSDSSHGMIIVRLVPNDDSFASAAAEFDEAHKVDLLKLREGDRVVVSGQVAKIFAGDPWLSKPSITPVA